MSPFSRFSPRHRRALSALSVSALFLCGVLVGRGWGKEEPERGDGRGLVATARASSPGGVADSASGGSPPAAPPRAFDPDEVDSATLSACGLEGWKVRMFLRYRAAGKRFRSESDLLDTYGWEQGDVERLRPYLRFGAGKDRPPRQSAIPIEGNDYARYRAARPAGRAEGEDGGRNPYGSGKFTEPTQVDINTADTCALRRIPGIGPYYARRVVGLRERLGGYTHVEQALEIGGFPMEALDWLTVTDTVPPRRLRLTDGIPALARHPYIGLRRARALHEWQDLYGAIADSAALSDTRIFSPGELELLLPYVEF